MDIWERMYEKAKEQYHPEEVSPFIYAHNVVCAIEAENGDIYTGFCIESCSGVMNICADRLAALNMYANSGQTKIKRFIAFRDSAPNGGGSGMPCGACQEFFYQLNEANEDMEIMVDYEKRETVTLKATNGATLYYTVVGSGDKSLLQLDEPTMKSNCLKPGQRTSFTCYDYDAGEKGSLYLKVKAYKNGKLIAVSYGWHYMIKMFALR